MLIFWLSTYAIWLEQSVDGIGGECSITTRENADSYGCSSSQPWLQLTGLLYQHQERLDSGRLYAGMVGRSDRQSVDRWKICLSLYRWQDLAYPPTYLLTYPPTFFLIQAPTHLLSHPHYLPTYTGGPSTENGAIPHRQRSSNRLHSSLFRSGYQAPLGSLCGFCLDQ